MQERTREGGTSIVAIIIFYNRFTVYLLPRAVHRGYVIAAQTLQGYARSLDNRHRVSTRRGQAENECGSSSGVATKSENSTSGRALWKSTTTRSGLLTTHQAVNVIERITFG